MILIIQRWPRCPVCKAVSTVGNVGGTHPPPPHSSCCIELCAQMPPLKSGLPGRPVTMDTLGLGGSGGSRSIAIGPSQTRWLPCPAVKSFQPVAWKSGHSNYRTIALSSHASKVMLKILQARLQQYVNHELPDVQAGFRKGGGTRSQIANIC